MPRLEERTELKCRMCGKLVPTDQYSYNQKTKKHRRRCPSCVAYVLYLRGDGPKPADASDAKQPEEYGHIELTEQLLPPQKLTSVSHQKTIVHASIPISYHSTLPRKLHAERDFTEENLDDGTSTSSKGFHSVKIEQASSLKFSKSPKKKKSSAKPKHVRQGSSSDQARALYMRQLKGRREIRASRDFDNEEEPPELLKGEKGRKRLSVLDGGYPRESMKPGPERVVGGK